MNRVQRARGINQIMTGVFYLIAVFFFTLLIGFASYVIIKGFTGATPEMILPLREKEASETVVQYNLSGIYFAVILHSAWSDSRNLSGNVCEERISYKISENLY